MEIVQSCKYVHPDLGVVKVKVCANSRSIRARWVGPEVHITIPRHCPTTDYDRFINDFSQRIKEIKPKSRFYAGQIIDGNYADFEIRLSDNAAKDLSLDVITDNPLRGKQANYIINIRRGVLDTFGFDSPTLESAINKAILRCAIQATGKYILPRARKLAAEVKREPLGWDVRDSRTRLGCCSSNGIITLSPRLIFLPLHLADSVIYHELAHLSEMNHSAAFHAICNAYSNGHEEEYRAAIKEFKFPVF